MALNIRLVKDGKNSYARQIFEQIRDMIKNGGLTPGDPFPEASELASQLGIDEKTVNSAYQVLEREGYINNLTKGAFYISLEDHKIRNKIDSKKLETANNTRRQRKKEVEVLNEHNKDLKEDKIKVVEVHLIEAIKAAKTAELSLDELKELLDFLDEEIL